MIVAFNGKVTEANHAVVSVSDHGFLYGMGLFETFRTYGGEPFLLERHFDRLQAGCEQLGMMWSRPTREKAQELIDRMLAALGCHDAYIRWSVSAGEAPLGLPAEPYYEKASEIVYMKPLPAIPEGLYERGRPLQQLKLARAGSELGGTAPRLKSFHYMNSILGKRELANYSWAKGAEGLFLNHEGFLSEGLVSNLFFMKNGVLKTPDVCTGALPGITRAKVLELAGELGIATEIGLFRWEDLLEADEAFMTNSVQELVPVSMLFDTEGTRTDLPSVADAVTARLLEGYRSQAHKSERGDEPSSWTIIEPI